MTTADADYNRLRRLIVEYIKVERSPKIARSSIFYEHVKSILEFREIPLGERESKVMREVALRYERGKGTQGEPTKFYEYFGRKFAEQIKERREELTGNRYRKNSWFDKEQGS